MPLSVPVTALVCRPGQSPVVETVVDRLEEWQRLVRADGETRGYIQIVHLFDGVVMICNEDGRATCKPNRVVPGLAPNINEDLFDLIIKPDNAAAPGTIGFHEVYGTFALVRDNGDGYHGSLSQEDIDRWVAVLELVERTTRAGAGPGRRGDSSSRS